MIEFITSHTLYIPFITLNVIIIYKIIKNVLRDDNRKNDDDDDEGGILANNNPVLDLPPGVTLPISSKEPVLND
ncbi:MAG: hypothetical protein H7098_12755 [Oligoflexus sp.]|nr:hypothetical protein [Pseudopedobacter sp.]